MLPAEGARAARSMISRTIFSGTGVGKNARHEYREATASRTSMVKLRAIRHSVWRGTQRAKALLPIQENGKAGLMNVCSRAVTAIFEKTQSPHGITARSLLCARLLVLLTERN